MQAKINSELIRKKREEKGISRDNLLVKLKNMGAPCSTSVLQMWEKGDATPKSFTLLAAIGKVLQIDLNELILLTEGKTNGRSPGTRF